MVSTPLKPADTGRAAASSPLVEAAIAKAFSAERNVARVRLAIVVFNSLVYGFLMSHQGTVEWLAYLIIGVALLYGLWVEFTRPYERFPVLLSAYFNSITDAVLITVWVYATGGWHSPFFVLMYAGVISIAFRFSWRETLIAATLYALGHIALLAGLDQLAPHLPDVTVRIGYIFLIAMLGGMFAREAIRAIEDKVIMRNLAQSLEAETEQRKQAEKALERYAGELEQRIDERTAELAQAKDRVEAILNNSSDAILLTSGDGQIQQVNPAFTRLFGLRSDDVQGQPLRQLVERDSAEIVTTVLASVVGKREPGRVEVVARARNGVVFDADIALAPFQDATSAEGRIGVICSLRDITAQKQLEKELRDALAKEKELNELKTRFTTMVSHEFRTPLAVIVTRCDLLRRQPNSVSEERRLEQIEEIRRQVKHLTALLDDILTISRAEAVGLDASLMLIDLTHFLASVVNDAQLSLPHHRITFRASADALPAMADAKLMQRAITNLLSNAAKYSPQHTDIELRLRAEGDDAVIEVEDHGIGIPAEDQAHLFEVFHRARNVGAISGTGLGLTIVQQAVLAHGGTVDIESTEGHGTTFTLRFPRATGSRPPNPNRPALGPTTET